jgi:LPS export ABC transporter protein LptC
MRRMVFSRGLWLLAGAAAVLGLIVSGWLVQTKTPAALPDAAPARADYYLRDAEVDVMDESGRLSYRLKTTELLRFNDHSSRLTDVDIDSLGGNDGVWRLQAGQALITENQEHLLLSGGVRMQTQGAQGATLLTTQTLNVELKDNRMATADPVHVKTPDFEVRAIGMQAGFKSRNLTLLNNVRSRHAP